MENAEKRLHFELIKFFNIESPYTKENSLYLADEIMDRISDAKLKILKK